MSFLLALPLWLVIAKALFLCGACFQFSGNLHKWCFAPRGCAFLYVRQPYLDEVMPVVISWLWKRPFQERFENLGTRDHTPLFCAGEALKFIDDCLGGQVSGCILLSQWRGSEESADL